MLDVARTTVARWLEEGDLDAPWSRAVSRWGSSALERGLVRPLDLPEGLVVITVGGATLGGSGKSRVALACTRALARAGHDVVLVGHGHRAAARRRGGARVVGVGDALDDVGDEALACARSLARSKETASRVRVVVGPRQEAVDLAASLRPRPTFLVVDGALQLRPRRSELAILAVDRDAPWGSGAVAPAGDLRAAPATLLAHADRVVRVSSDVTALELDGERWSAAAFADHVRARGLRLGLYTAIARPRRLEDALVRAGLRPAVVVRSPDHGPAGSAARDVLRRAEVGVWITTEKCASHLALAGIRRPVAIVRDEVELDADLVSHMRALTPPRPKA